MSQDEYFGLTFFMDGKQSTVTNGGTVSNWRYVAPGYDVDIAWFVAQAFVPCNKNDVGAEYLKATSGEHVWAKPRTRAQTENLKSISYNQNRIMKTVSKAVVIKNAADKYQAFNQRYTNKQADFGDIILKEGHLLPIETPNTGLTLEQWRLVHAHYTTWVGSVQPHMAEKQIAYYEMLKEIVKLLGSKLPGPYKYVRAGTDAYKALSAFKSNYLNPETYNISVTALATKAQKPPSYIATPIGETGWMVLPSEAELPVPNDEGEYFIGWSILNQPQNRDVADTENPTNGCKEAIIRWCQSNGYALHQGPGIMYMTGGDFAHGGTQEPYIMEHNYPPMLRENETPNELAAREKDQLPSVHWRLDKSEVILKSLELGAVTVANVGAGQKMLASIGTKTSVDLPSKSQNFLGRYYQQLLANPKMINDLVGKQASGNEVYEVVSVDNKRFNYGKDQQIGKPPLSTYYS
jgi:hypothetical protein